LIDLFPKQARAWNLLGDKQHTEILYGGAAGGAKTWLGCVWLLTSALRYQGTRWLMGRAVAKTLKETTLNSFFDVCSRCNLKAGSHYVYNAQTGIITLGASQIILKDLFSYPSDPNFDDLGSLEITGAFIDEANQVTEKAKSIVGSRIRYKLDDFDLVPKLLMTCNPAKNWVYRDFYHPAREGTLAPHRAFVPALVTDNHQISPHYIENLKKLPAQDRARLLDGDWDYDDDPSRLMDHDAIMDLFSSESPLGTGKYCSVDVARYGSDRTVIAAWEGLAWVHATVMDVSSVPQVAAAVKDLCRMEGIPRSHVVVDDDGVGGGVADLLPGCVRFNNGAKPIEVKGKEQNYMNLKAQCSYVLAEHVNDRAMAVRVQDHYKEHIQEELAHIKRDKMDNDGKLRLLPKEKVKEALGRSPDFADVMVMRMIFEVRGESLMNSSMYKKADTYIRKEREKAIFNSFPNRKTWR
jgi:phage terminase large subunit